MKLAEQFKGWKLSKIPNMYISKRYGNSEGSFVLYEDGSKGWIDPKTDRVLCFLQVTK